MQSIAETAVVESKLRGNGKSHPPDGSVHRCKRSTTMVERGEGERESGAQW